MDWMQLIGSYAFPIVACAAMGWYVKYITDANRKDIEALNDKWETTLKEVNESIKNNTAALTKLCAHIGGDDDDGR